MLLHKHSFNCLVQSVITGRFQRFVLRKLLEKQTVRHAPCACSMATDVRNIGIMAHIDAGKTTTSERMLFYSGHILRMGDIDSGDTVMDYLPTEIERGITVQSAAISFKWQNTQINLIDTPGHVDFTIEVERSLRVLDGAVAIFDGGKGVEAQSRTVWRQADHYDIPRIAFINKMDKRKANFTSSVRSLQNQLKANTALLQIPLFQDENFFGIIDVVSMEKMEWNLTEEKSHREGRSFTTTSLQPSDEWWAKCISARTNLIEMLCETYDDVTMTWLEGPHAGDAGAFSADTLRLWLRRATIDRAIVPVFCGSSLKNIAVQPLLDAVVHYLPRPTDIHHEFVKYYDNTLCAMAFKVLFNKRLGPLIFVRVYSGSIKTGMSLYNVNKSSSEKVYRLMNVFADEYREVGELKAGSIGLIAGFKHTFTGDTLVESKEQFKMAASKAHIDEDEDSHEISHAVLTSVPVPEPVFFCTIEVESITQEKALHYALDVISREDPSMRVQVSETGAITLCGMGELHMEIIAERIRKEFKIDPYIGPIQVAYKEIPNISSRHEEHYTRSVLGNDYEVDVDISLDPSPDANTPFHEDDILHHTTQSVSKHAAALGIVQACQKGNVLGYPVIGAKFTLNSVKAKGVCPPALITAAAHKCASQVLEKAECQLIEPVMNIEISAQDSASHNALNELHKRHAVVKDFTSADDVKIIKAEAPVAEMKGFTSSLRSATSGLADLSLEVAGYQDVSDERLHKIKQELSGAAAS